MRFFAFIAFVGLLRRFGRFGLFSRSSLFRRFGLFGLFGRSGPFGLFSRSSLLGLFGRVCQPANFVVVVSFEYLVFSVISSVFGRLARRYLTRPEISIAVLFACP